VEVLFFGSPVVAFVIAVTVAKYYFVNAVNRSHFVLTSLFVTILYASILFSLGWLLTQSLCGTTGGVCGWVMVGYLFLTLYSSPVAFILYLLVFISNEKRNKSILFLAGGCLLILLVLFVDFAISKYQYSNYIEKIDVLKANSSVRSVIISTSSPEYALRYRSNTSSQNIYIPLEIENLFSKSKEFNYYQSWSMQTSASETKKTLILVGIDSKRQTIFDYMIGSNNSGVLTYPLFIIIDTQTKNIIGSFELPLGQDHWSPEIIGVIDFNGDGVDELIYSAEANYQNNIAYALYFNK